MCRVADRLDLQRVVAEQASYQLFTTTAQLVEVLGATYKRSIEYYWINSHVDAATSNKNTMLKLYGSVQCVPLKVFKP